MTHTLLRRLHLWLSIPCGLFFSFLCLTGALLVFEEEVTDLVAQVAPEQTIVSEFTGRPKIPLYRTIRDGHRYLFDRPDESGGMSAGKMVVGVTTLLSFFVLVSGFLLRLPHSLRRLKSLLILTFRKKRQRFWFWSHAALGFWAAVLLIVMCLTGLTWSFDWYNAAFYGALGFVPTTQKVETVHGTHSATKKDPYPMMHRSGGAVSIKSLVKHIHMGSFGGPVTKALWLMASLVGTFLPLTGYYIWFRRLRCHGRK